MKHTIIIAEAGVNHNGSLALAEKMVDAAAVAGVDYIKFQTAIPEALVTKSARKADYQTVGTGSGESQLEMLRKLLLSFDDFKKLYQYCCEKKIAFLSTPFDRESIYFLEGLNMRYWKIPSGEITNYPYLVEIGKTRRDVILSTGMSTMEEIKQAIKVLRENGSANIQLLHCNTEYPTPMKDVNLYAMETMRQAFGVEVGYSDHTKGIEVPIAAAALGASIIEKHFTLDRKMEGPDHKASLEPGELSSMVQAIRNIEIALGDGNKIPTESELKNRDIARKSIIANQTICEGEVFTETNLTTKRPGNGISPMQWNCVIGKKAMRTYEQDELIDSL